MLTDNEKRALADALKAGRVWIAKGAAKSWAPSLLSAYQGLLLSPEGVVLRERQPDIKWEIYPRESGRVAPNFWKVELPGPDFAEYLGYPSEERYLWALEDHPSAVSRRLRNRLRKDGFLE